MSTGWTITTAIISSGAFSVLLTRFFDWLDRRKGRKDVNTKATMYCLLFSLQMFGEELVKSGCITQSEYKQFESMFRTYKAMGGDGFADKIKGEVDKLPITL